MVKTGLKPLFLILKKKYFDQIASGQKREEYREARPYWENRIEGREYSHIIFQNGYATDAPRIEIEYKGWYKKKLKHEFFDNKAVTVYALRLGKILNSTFINQLKKQRNEKHRINS